MVRKFLGILLLMALVPLSCKDEQNQIIPYVPVALTVNLNIYNQLTIPGNSEYLPGVGYGGIIVYCQFPGSYFVYDAACPHEALPSCRVVCEGVLGTCACCGSQFVLMDSAFPSKGPAKFPLQQYHVAVINNTLRIYN